MAAVTAKQHAGSLISNDRWLSQNSKETSLSTQSRDLKS